MYTTSVFWQASRARSLAPPPLPYLSIYLSTYLPTYLPTYLSIHPSIHPSIYLYKYIYTFANALVFHLTDLQASLVRSLAPPPLPYVHIYLCFR